jgi:protein-S-isoprenylcysteine O-methyltransferase Ste14
MPAASLFLRSLLFTILIPGSVAAVVPFLILSFERASTPHPWTPVGLLGLIPMIAGTVLLMQCIVHFARHGKGTLAPIDPPTHLVVRGPYRWVRNPMYSAVLAILIGECVLFQSVVLMLYTAAWFAMVNLFVLFYEEPRLRRQFGEVYASYCRDVRRWIPGRRRRGSGMV